MKCTLSTTLLDILSFPSWLSKNSLLSILEEEWVNLEVSLELSCKGQVKRKRVVWLKRHMGLLSMELYQRLGYWTMLFHLFSISITHKLRTSSSLMSRIKAVVDHAGPLLVSERSRVTSSRTITCILIFPNSRWWIACPLFRVAI